ncbi:DUF3472 domain-containing protein [Candidatus Bipolaricaulota bacterium]|nr:DUF3472 domain-containing protein [Candidatus Bipolaricaulota bacterium]
MFDHKIMLFRLTTALLCTIMLIFGPLGSFYAKGDTTPGGLAYVNYDWPCCPTYYNGTQVGFYNFDVFLTIEEAPPASSHYFWAHQFDFKNGEGGYLGLQTRGMIKGEATGKVAIASIWHALDAKPGPNGSCEQFTHEGYGWSCRLRYDWKEGRSYRLRLWELQGAEHPNQDEWWVTAIKDTVTGDETTIGKFKVPAEWKWLHWSISWVEYYGTVEDCESIPYAKARFSRPSADAGDFTPEQTPQYGDKCTNSRVSLTHNPQGAILETGQ